MKFLTFFPLETILFPSMLLSTYENSNILRAGKGALASNVLSENCET